MQYHKIDYLSLVCRLNQMTQVHQYLVATFPDQFLKLSVLLYDKFYMT